MTPTGTVPVDTAVPPVDASGESVRAAARGRAQFRVQLANFDGPFDLLLQLVGAHRLDITEVALSQVTDEFLSYLDDLGPAVDLDVVTDFLVVAATLLDLKAAKLLPVTDVEETDEVGHLEARDLLFARLLAYRAYQQVAVLFAGLEAVAPRRYPRTAGPDERYLGLWPEVRIGLSAAGFAALAQQVFAPAPPPVTVSLSHLHQSPVSVAEQTVILKRLLARSSSATFEELVADCHDRLEVVARFLGLLNLYRESAVVFRQPEALGELTVQWTGVVSADRVADEVSEEYDG